MDTNGKSGVIIGVIVLLVVLIGGWFITVRERHGMMAGNEIAATSTSTTASSTGMSATSGMTNPTTMASGDSVTVATQAAGTLVLLQSLSLSQSGWVAIRDNAGRTLGAALFPAGTESNVSIPLLRATSAGERYQALLYFDDGKKSFNLHTETLVENADGTVAGTMFSVK
jgi:hypothetical protein